ncbi:hypothetical protein [Burkholderia phage vB_BpP_HN02]|uniref:Uncharacterized protein n=1 Tax=Burkholderia phage vB_BpP_HN02 TaxID=3116925 RepID=A0AAX4JHP6_9CAUD
MAQPIRQYECLVLWEFMDDYGNKYPQFMDPWQIHETVMPQLIPLILKREEH